MTSSKIVRFVGAILMVVALVVFGGRPSFAEPSVSGTYVSVTPNSVELISLVQTADGRIVGRIESASLEDAGSVKRSAITVEGAGDGGTLLLTAQSILLSLGNPPSFSGIVEGDTLELSWQGGRRSYRRGTAEQSHSAVRSLEARSLDIRHRQAFDTTSANLLRMTQVLDGVEARQPELHSQLATSSQRYRDLFPRLHNRRRAQSALSAFPEPGLAAMRAGTDASSYALDIDAVGLEVTGHRTEMQRRFNEARSLAGMVDTYCAERQNGSGVLCRGLGVQRARLDRLSTATRAEFEAVEAAYREASVDVPPGRRWLDAVTGRNRR